MRLDKQTVADLIKEQMDSERADQSARQLHDQVDHEEHADALQQLGVGPSPALRGRRPHGWLGEPLADLPHLRRDRGRAPGPLREPAADACGRPVLTSPVEATAIGKPMLQAIALRLVDSLEQARRDSATIDHGDAL
jgi:hypothetical protein